MSLWKPIVLNPGAARPSAGVTRAAEILKRMGRHYAGVNETYLQSLASDSYYAPDGWSMDRSRIRSSRRSSSDIHVPTSAAPRS